MGERVSEPQRQGGTAHDPTAAESGSGISSRPLPLSPPHCWPPTATPPAGPAAACRLPAAGQPRPQRPPGCGPGLQTDGTRRPSLAQQGRWGEGGAGVGMQVLPGSRSRRRRGRCLTTPHHTLAPAPALTKAAAAGILPIAPMRATAAGPAVGRGKGIVVGIPCRAPGPPAVGARGSTTAGAGAAALPGAVCACVTGGREGWGLGEAVALQAPAACMHACRQAGRQASRAPTVHQRLVRLIQRFERCIVGRPHVLRGGVVPAGIEGGGRPT